LSFEATQPIWWETDGERRLLFYDVFRGLFGKVWALAPLYATAWTHLEQAKPSFDAERPPLPLLATREESGVLTDVFLDQHDHHYLYDSYLVHPRVRHFNWQAVLFEFDVTSTSSEVDLHFAVDGVRHSQRLVLPPRPDRGFYCTVATTTRDDNEIVGEWLEHCRSVGFDRFLLYENFNLEPLEVDADDVTVIDWPYPYYYVEPPGFEIGGRWGDGLGLGCQVPQQLHSLYKHGVETLWMAFMDTDEYLNLLRHSDLRSLLEPEAERTLVHLGSLFFGDAPVEGAETLRTRYVLREPPGHMNGFGYNRRKGILNVPNLLNGEHMVVHEFATERDPQSWLVKEPFSNEVRRQLPLDEARLNHYFSIGFARRNCDWPTSYYTQVRDDSILAMNGRSA
jgi:hypothetical protein